MNLKTSKTTIQGNDLVVTIPPIFNVESGAEFEFENTSEGVLILNPIKQTPKTMKELFKNWHGKYEMPESLKDWNDL